MRLMERSKAVDICKVLRIRFPLVFFTIISLFVARIDAQEADRGSETVDRSAGETAARSELLEWRDTLRFGINSEIKDLLPVLRQNQVDELSDEIAALAEQTENSALLGEVLAFFIAVEEYPIDRRVLELLGQYRDRPPEFTGELIAYLIAAEVRPSAEERAVLFEIAEDTNALRSTAAVRYLGIVLNETSALIDLYREGDVSEETRGAILVALGERGDPDAYDFVVELIGEDEEAMSTIQRYAIDTLGKLGDERAIPIILRQLDSNNATTRAYAVNALRGFDTEEATQAIVNALRDDFWRVRVAALETIAERRITGAGDAVIYKARRDPEQRVRLEAIQTMSALAVGWDEMRLLAERSNTAMAERRVIVQTLIESDYRASEETILRIIENEWDTPNSPLLDAIGRAISIHDSPEITPIVEQFLGHPNYILQIYAIRAVGSARIVSLRERVTAFTAEGVHRTLSSAALRALEQFSGS